MTDAATWDPPGPGSWVCDRSHHVAGPTPFFRRIVTEHTASTYRDTFEHFGAPAGTVDMQFVNGAMFRRVVPLVAPDQDKGKVPPAPVLWLASRLHPEFRRRNKRALETIENRAYLDDIGRWTTIERFEWKERNLELQAVDLAALDDAGLARHLRTLDAALVEGWIRHHQLHNNDLGPIGDLLVHAQEWGMDPVKVMELLQGDSPATVEAERHGKNIADALTAGGVDAAAVTDIATIRSVPAAAAALDDYLEEFGNRIVSDYDIEGRTLNEMPAAICAIVRAGTKTHERQRPDEAPFRAKAADPALFDQLLADARLAYGVRDDNGPLTWEWRVGLLRLAYLEAGGRLATAGRIATEANVFELDVPELAAVLDGAAAPTADAIVERAEHRQWEKTLTAPDVLGPVPANPDLSPLPEGLRRLMAIILTAVAMLEPDLEEERVPLNGLGVGSEPYQGIARVAHDPGVVIEEMDPGDVLVAAWTAPSFNAVFAVAGAVVVQEGGLLCHAAVMARELGIAGVIGCADAMTRISSGDLIEVDPVAGVVKVLEPAG